MTGSEKPTEAGDATGPAETLLRQLGLRFGAIPEAAATWVRGADVTSLDRWAETMLSAPSLQEALLRNLACCTDESALVLSALLERVNRGEVGADEEFWATSARIIRATELWAQAQGELTYGKSLEAHLEDLRRPGKVPTDALSIVEVALANTFVELEGREREEPQPAPDDPSLPGS